MDSILLVALETFVQSAPVVVVMGYVVYTLWHELKDERKMGRESEVENLRVMKELSSILEKSLEENRTNFKEVRTDVRGLQTFLDTKIDRMERRLKD